MRLALLLAVVALGCSGHGESEPSHEMPVVPAAPFARVTDPSATIPLAKVSRPHRIVWIGPSGALETAVPADPWTGLVPANRSPVASLDALQDLEPELDALADRAIDLPDGVNRPPSTDPGRLERDRAVATARKLGVLANDRNTGRLRAARGVRDADDDVLLVLAAPDVPAVGLVTLLERFGGSIGVLHGDQLAALRTHFLPASSSDTLGTPERWIELHVDARGLHVVVLPSNAVSFVAWTSGPLAATGFRATFEALGPERAMLDVLVARDVSEQRLVDLLVGLDQLGVTKLALGESTGSLEQRHAQVVAAHAASATYATPTVWLGLRHPSSMGDLDKSEIKRVMHDHVAELAACYDKAAAMTPAPRGLLVVQFFIDPGGKVQSSNAQGVDRATAACIGAAVGTFRFPKPKGGGGVQVSFPIQLDPAEH